MRKPTLIPTLPTIMMLAGLLAGCDATVELTKAPFDASTALSDGTFQASSEITQPIKEFTSSTTPGSWFAGDNSMKAEQKVKIFAAYSYSNLQSDVAKGHGEYLTALATLVGLPPAAHQEFFQHLQNDYPRLYADNLTQAESYRLLIDTVWNPVVRPRTD